MSDDATVRTQPLTTLLKKRREHRQAAAEIARQLHSRPREGLGAHDGGRTQPRARALIILLRRRAERSLDDGGEHGITIFDIDRKQDPLMQHVPAPRGVPRDAAGAHKDRMLLDRLKRSATSSGAKRSSYGRLLALRMRTFVNEMAQALPRGEFTKLGLNANNLKTAFSSLSCR